MTDTTGTPGGPDRSPNDVGSQSKQQAHSQAPVYAAGIMVAGGLLFGAWGVTHAVLEGDGLFGGTDEARTAVSASSDGSNQDSDGVVTLPDRNNDGVPDDYEDRDGQTQGRPHEDEEAVAPSSDRSGQDKASKDAGPETYIIESGDTLSQISAETGVPIGTLVKQNDIQDPNLIYAGSALLIPQAN